MSQPFQWQRTCHRQASSAVLPQSDCRGQRSSISKKSDANGRRKPMTRLQQTRRELLKSGAAMSAAVSFAKYGITPSWSAAGAKKDGLNVVDEVLRQAADTKEVPGVVAVAANGDGVVYEGAFGKRDLAKGTDMTADSVFWIASMTKALTATAAMQLVEQGKLQLDEPISKILPELAAPQVLEGFDPAGEPKLRPARRPITLRHLITHTAGFVYDIWNAEMGRYMEKRGIPGIISCQNAALALPLVFEPGEKWDYGINIDWVGKAVERASGQKLGDYF